MSLNRSKSKIVSTLNTGNRPEKSVGVGFLLTGKLANGYQKPLKAGAGNPPFQQSTEKFRFTYGIG